MHTQDMVQDVPRTVQEYLDESPRWADGTEANPAPMTGQQWRIWSLATAGKFFEGLVVFMTGVSMPIIVEEFQLGEYQKGLMAAATLFGVLIGATALGGMADTYGRKKMFIVEMIVFTAFLALMVLSPDFTVILFSLFGMGVALGCDYPTAHIIISESIPSNMRGRLVLSAFGFQAVGALVGTIVGYLILANASDLSAWRWMYATALIPAVLVIIGRFFIPDSAHWLVSRGRIEEAEKHMAMLLRREPVYPKRIVLKKVEHDDGSKGGFMDLFRKKKTRRATILSSIPWLLQDLSTYGIGIFTPIILADFFGADTLHKHTVAALIHSDMLAAKGSALLDLLLIVGIVVAFFLVDRVGRISLQVIGFIGCAIGLFLASLSLSTSGYLSTVLLFSGFMFFNFMTNMGPNAMTYLIAGEVFPTKLRGRGAGVAASVGKIGAVMTAFFFPVLLKDIGTEVLLYILVFTSLAGALVTWFFRMETKGLNLEKLDEA